MSEIINIEKEVDNNTNNIIRIGRFLYENPDLDDDIVKILKKEAKESDKKRTSSDNN